MDRAIAQLAARQHGVVTRRQLLALGIGRGAIAHRLANRRLWQLYHGVYAYGHSSLRAEGRWLAAVLACGEGSVLSHRSAVALHGVGRTTRTAIDVTTPRPGRRSVEGIDRHAARGGLHPDDITSLDAIPVTTIARTLLDLAEVVPRRRLDKSIEEADRRSLLDLAALDALIARSHGRHGLKPLAAALAAYRPEPAFTREELERRFLALCREAGLPPPAVNIWLGDKEVDFLWPDERIVVEVDGWDTHRTRAAFERDRARDAQLTAQGYRVIRFTWRQITQEPHTVIALLSALFAPSGRTRPA